MKTVTVPIVVAERLVDIFGVLHNRYQEAVDPWMIEAVDALMAALTLAGEPFYGMGPVKLDGLRAKGLVA